MPHDNRAIGPTCPNRRLRWSDLIGVVHDCATAPARWADVIRDLCVFTASAAGTVAIVSFLDGRESTVVHHGNSPACDRLDEQRRHWTDALIQHSKEHQSGQPSPSPQAVGHEVLTVRRARKDLDLPQWFTDTTMAICVSDRSELLFLGLTRHGEQPHYDESERDLMRMLIPHVQRALTLCKLIEHRTVQHEQVLRAVDTLDIATFLIDDQMRLLHENASGASMLSNGTIARVVGGVLGIEGVSLAALMATQRNTGQHVQKLPAGGCITPGGMVLTLMALGRHYGTIDDGGEAHVVFIQEAGQAQPMDSQLWIRLYELTAGELRVLQGLVQGLTPAEMSAMFGVAHSTVKTHVLNVFRKTGTNRQADLVQTAMATMLPFRRTPQA